MAPFARALRRRTRSGARGRLVTRPQLEHLEHRSAPDSLLDLFGLSLAGPSLFGPPGDFSASETVSAADQRPAETHPSPSPATSLLASPTALQNSESGRSSSAAAFPPSSRESPLVLDPPWGGILASLVASWDQMGRLDALPHGTRPTELVAAGMGSAASGGQETSPGSPAAEP